MITVHALMFNESLILPYFVKHYRTMFPDCRIVLFDNESTDNSVKIAHQLDCEIITYQTGGKLSDATYLKLKNSVWKSASTEWVVVCDCDEFLHVTKDD